ncbi:manganese-dependent inorganic pyrophosphatase [Sediminibacillus halophilus]|uniref:Probable manganese-dependent inorganic pyrophosphatase n=1 Tax=Sediminibacillus halophilus TaxID=482461 RepID=A0A1G9VG25_9BACI|nr:manganese-dependent inorganic pyrophosphatase [Sediminibacillus halophilus]SDM71021.1 manganese-dependent inorganic pyrophosphatase [Sediminibacillus halophilus]
MDYTLIFGHKNPDTDAICSALAYADLKKRLGFQTKAVRLGEVSKETQFALDTFSIQPPELAAEKLAKNQDVILVDHNEHSQSIDSLEEGNILEVIDHHRISNFSSEQPVYFRTEPVGCTATILYKIYKEHGLEPDAAIAGLMLSAIISDTLLFKSPTSTEADHITASELSKLATVDMEAYGMELLKAGAGTENLDPTDIITIDAKLFKMGSANVEIAQVNVVDTSNVQSRSEEIKNAISERIENNDLAMFVLLITDILTSESLVMVLGEEQQKFEQAFSTTLKEDMAFLSGIVSRKKQVVPPLTQAFAD